MFGRMIGYVEDADKLEKAADELIPRCICHVYACMHACVYACMRVCVCVFTPGLRGAWHQGLLYSFVEGLASGVRECVSVRAFVVRAIWLLGPWEVH